MKTTEFAKEYIMEEYLGVMLDDSAQEIEQQQVARLLQQVPENAEQLEVPAPEQEPVEELETTISQASMAGVSATSVAQTAPPQEAFQALLFEVAGLTLAVPLTELGGIHQTEKVSSLVGKPDWFLGVMLYREEKINVVDTAQWVMPEKYSDSMASDLDYQYLVMLGTSEWGLGCENLIDTLVLHPEQIKWRQTRGKRPWLAGVVKDKMCALLDVAELIGLLEQGLNSNKQ